MSQFPTHPEFDTETSRLKKTVDYIWLEMGGVGDSPPMYGVKYELQAKHQFLSDKLKVMRDALDNAPYYARFDFQEAEQGVQEYYVSKFQGLQLLEKGPIKVIYWASPIGGLYAQTTHAKVSYAAPKGMIHGRISLRRQLLINQRELQQIIDEFDARPKASPSSSKTPSKASDEPFILNPDEYLRLVLEGKRGKGLTEVVTSIQERQNDLMRTDRNQILYIQGPAGSGKTTIALHRIAILLYAAEWEEKKDPTRLMVIGANRLFLNFVSQVLPSININNVPQRTFVDWAKSISGLGPNVHFPDKTFRDMFDSKLDKDKIALKQKSSKFKGSLQVIPVLERLAEQYRVRTKLDGLAFFPLGSGSLSVFIPFLKMI